MRKFIIDINTSESLTAVGLFSLIMNDSAVGLHPIIDEFLDHHDIKRRMNTMVVSEALKVCGMVLRAVESHIYAIDILESPTDYI